MDAGQRDAGEEPPRYIERTHWAIYRGYKGLEPQYGTPEAILAVALDAQPSGTASPQLLPSATSLWGYRWSSDGQWLISRSDEEESELLLWDMTGAQLAAPERLRVGAGLDVADILPSPVGARFLVTAQDKEYSPPRLYVLEPASSTLRQLPIEATTRASVPKWAPSGDAVLVETIAPDLITEAGPFAGKSELAVIDLVDPAKEPLRVVPESDGGGATSWSDSGRWIAAEKGGYDPLFLVDVTHARSDVPATWWRAQFAPGLPHEVDRILAWSPNSAWLLLLSHLSYEAYAPELQLVDMRGAQPSEPIVPVDQPELDRIYMEDTRWSPDSKRVLVLRSAPSDASDSIELLVFDVNEPQAGPILQREILDSVGKPLVAWTAQSSLVFQDGTSLFINTFDDGADSEELADDLNAGERTTDRSEPISLSPDGYNLLYPSASRVLRMIRFGATIERRTITLEGDVPNDFGGVRWLPDSSGFIAATGPALSFGSAGCRLEYVMLDATGTAQPPITVPGRAECYPDQVALQP